MTEKRKGPVVDLPSLLAALRAPGAKRQVRAAAASEIEYLQSRLRNSVPMTSAEAAIAMVEIPVDQVWQHDAQFRQALESIQRCAIVALLQGPLSRRNALREISDMALAAISSGDRDD